MASEVPFEITLNDIALQYLMSPRPPILQYWDNAVPAEVQQLMDGVQALNPTFEYRFFNDETAAQFIEAEFGPELLGHYQSCAIPAMRSDFFRYCFLERCGGFYIDTDFVALHPIDQIIEAHPRGCLYLREKGLTNSMMYFRDSHDPLAERIRRDAAENIASRSSNNVWQVTGPGIMRNLQSDGEHQHLFDGLHMMEEDEFAHYFKPKPHLLYKRTDAHWSVARDKGISIFND